MQLRQLLTSPTGRYLHPGSQKAKDADFSASILFWGYMDSTSVSESLLASVRRLSAPL